MKSQIQFGSWLEHTGQLILFVVFLTCMVDLYGFAERGELLISLTTYLSLIFSGVILHIIASPIKHIQSTKRIGKKMPGKT